MIDVIRQILNYLVSHYALYLVITMGVIASLIIGVLTFVKKPIKKWTSKIPNPQLRKLANKMFILFAFVISFVAWVTLHFIAPSYFGIEAVEILLTGAFSVVLYAFGDGVITKSKAQQLVDTIAEVANDEQTEKTTEKKQKEQKPKSAIEEYLKKVK